MKPCRHLAACLIVGGSFLLSSSAFGSGCRSGDRLAPYQECPIYSTDGAALEVDADGELCEKPEIPYISVCIKSGTTSSDTTYNGVRYQYEAKSISRNRWEIVSISPEPPNRNQWPSVVGRFGSRRIEKGDTITVNAAKHFEDPNGDDLAFEVDPTFDFARYDAEVGETEISITVHSVGEGKFTIRANDPGGLFATSPLYVDVVEPRQPVTYMVPLFLSSWYPGGQGYVRVISKSTLDGEFQIEPFDDEGNAYDIITVSLRSGQTVHFNSDDLEDGNKDKGIARGIGRGNGDWRLEITSKLDLDVLAYMRTDDGFVSSLHDLVESDENNHRVVYFNPGRNSNQVSKLRIGNPGDTQAEAKVTGIDDLGEQSAGRVLIFIPPGGARTIAIQDMESGNGMNEGELGQGSGKWQLMVTAEQPIWVMSLLQSPTGHLTNLSTYGQVPIE